MAIKTVIVDDLDGSADATTVTFALDGASYELDLSEKNKAALFNVMAPYIEAARVVSRRGSAARGRRSDDGRDSTRIRQWANANGHAISARGRISRTVMDAYRDANKRSA
jgi:Lsr2